MKGLYTLFLLCILSSTASAEQDWWGYVNGDETLNGIGISNPDTYHCAIFIPGDHAIAAGKTINAVRFGLVATHATNAKVWVASSLPTTIDATTTLGYADVPDSKLGNNQIDIELPTPVAIPAEGVYVGYSFTITTVENSEDAYPVLFCGEPAINTLLIKTGKSVTTWTDLYQNGFGRLFLQVLLEGTFAGNTATAADFGPVFTLLGESATATIAVTNAGSTPLNSIDYTITTDGITGAEQHADIATPIAYNKTGKVSITVAADHIMGAKAKTLNITKANGQANTAADNAATFTLYTLPELVERKVAVEDFTGTGSGWCPRGLAGMKKLRQTFGNRFVGIGLHQYSNSDPMYIDKSAYANVGMNSAPSCCINRGEIIDPYDGSANGICEDFAAEMAIPALAKVNVSGIIDEGLKKVRAKALVEALLDNSEYTLEFVVIGDSLTDTDTAWDQANNYPSRYSASELPDDLAIFANGGIYGTDPITGWKFNDVALASSYMNYINQVPGLGTLGAGEQTSAEYTLTMPTKTTLKEAVKNAKLYIVALLVDSQGKIINADKQPITVAEPSGIENVSTTDSEQTASYTLDGRRIQTMQKGINIVRMANGKTMKVVSK